MAKAKKTKKEKEVTIEDQSEQLEQLGDVTIAQKRYDECEWVFQFDEDSPEIFAWTDNEMDKNEDPKVIFTISNIENSFISFKNSKNGKLFKIFARPMSDDGKALREKQREAIQNFKTDLENGSENKETQA